MSTIVMITGTNCSGKTTLAKELINRFGGIAQTLADRTICSDPRMVFAGRYAESLKHGGCDGLNQTKCLADIAKTSFASGAEFLFCEGSYLNTFGMNLTNLLFSAEKQLVICLVAPMNIIKQRLKERTGSELKDTIVKKQQLCINSAKKWVEIGVPLRTFDVSKTSTGDIADYIMNKLEIN